MWIDSPVITHPPAELLGMRNAALAAVSPDSLASQRNRCKGDYISQ